MPRVAGRTIEDRDVEGDDGLEEDMDMECGLFRLDEQDSEQGDAVDQGTPALGATRATDGLASSANTIERSRDLGQEDSVLDCEGGADGTEQEQDGQEVNDYGNLEEDGWIRPRIEFHGAVTTGSDSSECKGEGEESRTKENEVEGGTNRRT